MLYAVRGLEGGLKDMWHLRTKGSMRMARYAAKRGDPSLGTRPLTALVVDVVADRQHGARRLVILGDDVADADLVSRVEFSPPQPRDRLRFGPRLDLIAGNDEVYRAEVVRTTNRLERHQCLDSTRGGNRARPWVKPRGSSLAAVEDDSFDAGQQSLGGIIGPCGGPEERHRRHRTDRGNRSSQEAATIDFNGRRV